MKVLKFAGLVIADDARLARETKQRTLTIEGDVRLGFWPNVALSLGKVSVSGHKGGKAFASNDSCRIRESSGGPEGSARRCA